MAIPGSVFSALKQAAPGKTDAELVALYDEVKKLSPGAATMDPMDLARTVLGVAKSRGDNAAMAQNQVAAAQPQQVVVTGPNPFSPLNARPTVPQNPEISTTLPSPYAGTAMMARNPTAPAAAQVGQFDPEALNAAYADYARRYAETAGQRQLGQGLAAAAGPDALTASRQSYADLDKQNMLLSIEKQKALQEQATAGLAAATSAQTMDKTAGEYQLSKAKGIQDLEQARQKTALGGMDVLQRQKFAKPGTTMARVAFDMLQRQAQQTNQPLPPGVSPDTMSAEDMMAYMEPKLLKAFQEISTGRKAEAEAKIGQAVANTVTTPGGPAPATPAPAGGTAGPVGVNNVGNLKDPKTGKFRNFDTPAAGMVALKSDIQAKINKGFDTVESIITRYAPPSENDTANYIKNVYSFTGLTPGQRVSAADVDKIVAAIIRQEGNTKLTQPLPSAAGQPTLSAEGRNKLQFGTTSFGGVTLPPDPRVVAAAVGEGNRGVAASDRAATYDNYMAPTLKALRSKIAEIGSGKGTAFAAAWLPTESRELLNLLQEANNIYPGTLPATVAGEVSKSIQQGGFTGALVASLDNGQLARVIDRIEQNAMRDRASARDAIKARESGATPGSFEVNRPISSSRTTEMVKNGVTYDIPVERVEAAKAQGYKVK